ncbi:hypothetical protein KAI04_03535 [Candidatus Pacearchaeota archaeon]|nr:hypothetical protein [Candidatus Pacearchaeota archaeon]
MTNENYNEKQPEYNPKIDYEDDNTLEQVINSSNSFPMTEEVKDCIRMVDREAKRMRQE